MIGIIIIVIIIVITLDNSLTIITAVKLIFTTLLLFLFVVRTRLSVGRVLRFAALSRVVLRAPGDKSHDTQDQTGAATKPDAGYTGAERRNCKENAHASRKTKTTR